MPLQNRVTPFGEIEASPARGLFMGNRGGRIHRDDKTLTKSRWKTKAWIICVLEFNGWHREVMGNSYTELFFLDEATALTAGHRPCYLCQRARALEFAGAIGGALKAPQIDAILHGERRAPPKSERFGELPTGAIVEMGGRAHLITDTGLRPWSHTGYGPPSQSPAAETQVSCLTPPVILRAIRNGYTPRLHPSARTKNRIS